MTVRWGGCLLSVCHLYDKAFVERLGKGGAAFAALRRTVKQARRVGEGEMMLMNRFVGWLEWLSRYGHN